AAKLFLKTSEVFCKRALRTSRETVVDVLDVLNNNEMESVLAKNIDCTFALKEKIDEKVQKSLSRAPH
ncbi:hypothetical protein HMI54_009324, partial [Coelomomyces lativittatus]